MSSPKDLRRGFSLVELLVVITIIGMLIALLLPAVQSARESARRLQCINSLRQVALGMQTHLSAHNCLPTGGWGNHWIGDPDRGFGRKQPGGWAFSLLPYIEQQSLHDLGLGDETPAKREASLLQRAATPVPTLICPTRRSAILYPQNPIFEYHYKFGNLPVMPLVGRTDYAGNGGTTNIVGNTMPAGPMDYDIADNQWSSTKWSSEPHGSDTGVIYGHSSTNVASITDGLSNTYLVGEKYCTPGAYDDASLDWDDQVWDAGMDWDTVRFTGNTNDTSDNSYAPRQDTPGETSGLMFGSAHATGFHMALCDGSVHCISYSIDIETHWRLGNCSDGKSIDAKKLKL